MQTREQRICTHRLLLLESIRQGAISGERTLNTCIWTTIAFDYNNRNTLARIVYRKDRNYKTIIT